ncbi:2-oxo acid dehydrogenase subunit E2 [Roseobacter weihaiensis]|uniref:2-oxo acid dehydrogenase subunit E2 n=1 Tax=Roseobacter weihaiensis TaxID=2763262 RepID=UPI001D09D3C1|nr:2-oxo acid dehydrogenase subunit E2 [Roseobacter sp. H9]
MSQATQLQNKVIPLRGARGMIADKMSESLATAAQLTHHGSADATALLAKKAKLAEKDIKVSIEDLILEAVVRAIPKRPEINGIVKDREVHLSENIDLGVAIALDGGLLVAPAMFESQGKDAAALRVTRQDLVARARTNKLTVTEMTGGTFTVSNLGLSRVEQFTPIINTPQIAILGVGRLTDRAVRGEDGGLELRPHMGLSLTFDHRAIDGAPAADALTAICEEIEAA